MNRAEQINTREHARLMADAMDLQAQVHELSAQAAEWLPDTTPSHRTRLAESRRRHAAEARECAAEFRAKANPTVITEAA